MQAKFAKVKYNFHTDQEYTAGTGTPQELVQYANEHNLSIVRNPKEIELLKTGLNYDDKDPYFEWNGERVELDGAGVTIGKNWSYGKHKFNSYECWGPQGSNYQKKTNGEVVYQMQGFIVKIEKAGGKNVRTTNKL